MCMDTYIVSFQTSNFSSTVLLPTLSFTHYQENYDRQICHLVTFLIKNGQMTNSKPDSTIETNLIP